MSVGLVSIIMPAFNAEETIAESLLSVLSQTFQKWELIVVDDGSSDGTSEVVKRFQRDQRVHLFAQKNSGVAAARNFGIEKCRGEFVAFLDADDLWLPHKLDVQMKNIAASCETPWQMVYSAYSTFTDSSKNTLRRDDSLCFCRLPVRLRIRVYDFIATSTVLMRRSVFEQIGYFDENLFGTEDWDLWIRLLSRFPGFCLNEPLVLYRENAAGISKNIARHLAEEWKVLEKQVVFNPEVPCLIRNKAVYYYTMKKMLNDLRSKSLGAAALTFFRAFCSFPVSILWPGNYFDALLIYWGRYIVKKW